MDITDQDVLNFLSTKPKTVSTVSRPPRKQFDADQLAQEYMSSNTVGGGTGIPEYQSNLKEIWNGFRQGRASVVDSIDSVVNLISKVTGLEKGGAFEKLKDAWSPTPEELADQNFGATLLRAIGAAGPIIAEFAVGTKGAGTLLKAARIPAAIKGIALAPAVAFGGIEGLTTAGKGGTLSEVAKATGKGALMGGALGAAGLVKPALHIPAVGTIFGGMTALEGGETQDIMIQTLMGLGFGAHGAIKSAKQVNTMRDFLSKNGYNPDIVDKMGINKLRSEFDNTRKRVITDSLISSGMPVEEVAKLSDIQLEETFTKKSEEIKKVEQEKAKVTKEAIVADPEAMMAKNRQTYVDFLIGKGFNSEILTNVSNLDVRNLALAADPGIWEITPEGKIKQVEKKVKKENIKQSIEELEKEVATATSQAVREKALLKLAKKQTENAKLVKDVEEVVLKEAERVNTDPEAVKTVEGGMDPATKIKIKLASTRVFDDWGIKDKTGEAPRLTVDEFEAIRTQFAIPEANRDEMFQSFKDNGIVMVEKKAITDTDMTSLLDKTIEEGSKEDTKPKIPPMIRKAFQERKKKIITEAEWNTLKPEDKVTIEKYINEIYASKSELYGEERAYEKWLELVKVAKKENRKSGRPPGAAGTTEGRKVLAMRIDTSIRALRTLLSKANVRLAAETEEATGIKKEKVKLKTPLIKLSKPLRTHLKEKLKWNDIQLNQLSSKEDITKLRRLGLTPEEVGIDDLGRIVFPDELAKKGRIEELRTLVKTTEDDVLKAMGQGYTQEEIDTARKEVVIPSGGKGIKEGLAGMGKAVVDNLYDDLFKALSEGKNTLHGVKDPALVFAKPLYDKGFIKNVTDLKKFIGEDYGKKPIKKEEKPVKVTKKGEIKTLEGAQAVYDRYMELKETAWGKDVEDPNAIRVATDKMLMGKEALEKFIGKGKLRDGDIQVELDKMADAGADAYLEKAEGKPSLLATAKKKLKETRGSISFKKVEEVPKDIIVDEKDLKEIATREGPKAQPETGEVNPDEIVAKAYARSRNPTPLEKSEVEFAKEASKLYTHQDQAAKLRLAILNKDTDPALKVAMKESLALMEGERDAIVTEMETKRQAYTDMQISVDVPTERTKRYNGPRTGEIKIETSKQLGDGTGGLIISEGGQGVDRFYLTQDPLGGPSPADSTGNKISAEIRLTKSTDKPKEVELQLFKTTEGINPVLEDSLLKTVIDKYTDYGQSKMVRVKRVPGVGDSIWDRREDIEKTVRKSETQSESRDNIEENIRNYSKTHGYVNWLLSTGERIVKGGKGWKQKYEERQDLLESLSTLKQVADPQQFDPERFRAEVFPEYDRMLGLVELIGDPTLSKIPIIRYITQKIAKQELNIQGLTNHYTKKLHEMFDSTFLKDTTKQEAFWRHVHKNRTSTDPEILDAYEKYRMFKEDMASVLGAKERGWYLEEYGTVKYDMNKVWDILKEPFDIVSSYSELNSKIQASLTPDMFGTAKQTAEKYKTWDSMPRTTQDWIQQNIFNFHGVWSGWEYLPEFLQRVLPKKFFVANMQARTVGDALKGALSYDFFDIEKGYITSMVRGALMNDALMEVRPLINQLPGASRFGSVRSYLERYVKTMAGGKPSILDPWWNSMVNSINETLDTNLLPLYFPSTVSKTYIPQLYRGLLGVDTAFRNLTQQIYSMANSGGRPVFKGALRYVDEWKKKTPEFQKFEELSSLPDEFLELGRVTRAFGKDTSLWENFKYVNAKLTRAALWPMKVSEHINKGVAYFAGLEEAAAKGYDMNTAHIVGTAKASSIIPSLELTEGQYKAFRSMGEAQFLYTSAHTSPYLQGAGMKMMTPFFSFPIKTAQLMWNNLLLNPVGGKTIMGKKDYAWMRFMALTGFMATAPIVSANIFGTDTRNIWGKGLFPMTIVPAWMEAVGNIWKSTGGDPGDFMETEKARNYMLKFVGQITIPWYRWGGKVYRDVLNAERGYREYGREQRPIVETSYLDEVRDIFGFPPSKFREAMDEMKVYKDEKSKNMLYKHYYLYKAVDAMQDKDFDGALSIIKEAKKDKGIEITPIEVQQAIEKKKDDIWLYTKTSAPKAIKERPGFQAGMEEARKKFIPSKARAYGSKPMWSSLSETIEQTSQPEISLEE